MNTPMHRDDRSISRAWPQGHWRLPALREAWSAPARAFGLAAALLTAAVLLAPSPAAAHSAGGDAHAHVYVQLNPSTITEGQTTTVGFSASGTTRMNRYGSGINSQHNTAYMDVTKTAAAPAATGAGAVNFSTNTRFSWTAYLNGRPGAGTLAQSTASGTVTITAVNDSVITGTRTVTVSLTRPCGVTDYWYVFSDQCPTIHSAILTILDNDTIPISLALGAPTINESGAGNSTTVRATLGSAAPATVLVAVSPTSSTDFTWMGGTTLTIASGATTSTNMLTITATDDATGGNKTVTLTGAPPSSSYSAGTATLTIVDDDARIVLSESDLTVIEETTGTYTVRLSIQPTGNVLVRAVRGGTEYELNRTGGMQGGTQDLTFTTNNWNTAQVITVIALQDNDAAGSSTNISHTTVNANTADDYDDAATSLPLTIMDNDAAILVSRGTGPLALTEPNAATYTVTLRGIPAGTVVVGVTSDDAGAVTVAPASLTFGQLSWNTGRVVTVTAVDDADGTNETVTVTHAVNDASSTDEFDPAPDVTFTVNVTDDEFGLVVGSVTGQATEGGGTAAFPVTLLSAPAAAVTVAVASQDTTEGTAAPAALTFSPTTWNTAQTVIVTGADDPADDGHAAWDVRLTTTTISGDRYHNLQEDVAVTTTDNDGPPGVTVMLNPSSIAESGTGNVATVTARLTHPSGAATTLTVTVASGFTVGAGAAGTIVIAAGETTSTDTATVTAVDNDTDAPDRTATVTATVTNAQATADSTMMAVTGAALTITDDDAAPTAGLFVGPGAISENGGTKVVAAVLSHESSAVTTVTVTAVPGAYTVGTPAFIVTAAGSEVSTDTVTITAVDDDVHQGSAGRSVTVTGRMTNTQGAGGVTGAALTLSDDETLPTADLVLTPAAIAEAGGVATVTATLSGRSSEAVTLTVATTAVSPAVAADFAQSGTTLMIAAGATTSTGAVTVTAADNNVASGNKQVTVSGTAAGGHGVAAPTDAALTLTDDDTPQAALVLTPGSIGENGGVATVTATLDRQVAAAVTVTVSATAVAPAVAGDFTLSTTPRLLFAANATTSTGTVTLTAVTNETDAPNKRVTVSGMAADGAGTGGVDLTNDPPDVTLTITDDDPAPNAALTVSPTSIHEIFASGTTNTAAVQATLDRPSSEPTTVTVTPVAGAYTVRSGTDGFIVIAAGTTATAGAPGVATINAVDDAIHQGTAHRTTTVTAELTNSQGAGTVAGAMLTLTDNEPLPTVTLAVTPTSVTEAAQTAQVRATLSGASSQAVTLTVATTAGTGTLPADFTQTGTTLMIAAETTASTGTVTVRSTDNNVDAADKSVTVSATAAGGHSIANPAAVTLPITDDEATPTATLVLTPSTILENGEVSTVTARLSHPTTAETRLTITTTAVPPAVTGDFTRSGSTLTVAAGATTSTGTVTVTSVDNMVASGRKQVRVAASAAGGRGVAAPTVVTLIIRDDEFGLDDSAVTGQATEGGGTAAFTVRLQTQPTAAVTVTVTSQDLSEGTVSPAVLVFTTSTWETAQPVTVTGVDDAVDDGDVTWQVRLDPSSSDTNYNGLTNVDVDVTTEDDDDAPTVTLVLTPPAITENGGVATVTATLSYPSTAATAITVTATPVTPAVAGDVALSGMTLAIAASQTTSTGVVTLTATDNAVDAADKTVTVAGTAVNTRATADMMTVTVTPATLTLEDDDERGFTFEPPAAQALVVAAGGTTTYTVALTSMPDGTVTATVPSVVAGEAVRVTRLSPQLSFTTSDWNTAQPVTVTATANADAAIETVFLSHAAGGAYPASGTRAVTVRPASGTTEVRIAPGMPATPLYNSEDAVVLEVRADADVPTGIVVDPAGLPPPAAGEVPRLRFRSRQTVDESIIRKVADVGFNLGPAEALTVVDVSLEAGTVPATGLTLCLPVPAPVEEAAQQAGQPLVLLHYDGSVWTRVPGSGADGSGAVCGQAVTTFSPFAVGYRDSVTVTFAPEVPEEIRRETTFKADDPTQQAKATFSNLSEDTATAAAARNGFRLGRSTVHVALAVTVTPSVPGRLCLGVPQELVRDAKMRTLVLLDEGKARAGSVPETDVDADEQTRVVRVCADVEGLSPSSPFAVGYRGVVFSPDDQNKLFPFRTGQPVTEEEGTLPSAKGDRAYSYELPEAETLRAVGLAYEKPAARDDHGGTITGTPTATLPERTYTLRATDAQFPDEMAELAVRIKVDPGIKRRDLELVLAGIGRTLASDAVEILGSRSGPPPARLHVTLGGQVLRLTNPAGSAPAASAPSPLAGEGGGEGAIPAAPSGPSPWQRVTGVAVDVARAFGVTLDTPALSPAPTGPGRGDGSTFQRAHTLLSRAPADARRPASPTWRSPFRIQPVSAKDLLARSAFELPLTRTGDDGLPTWTLWGRGAASGFAGQPEEGFKMDGTLYSGYLGLDYRPRSSLLMGLAVAHSTGQVDYERTGGTKAGVDVKLTSLLPYAHWQPAAGLGVWGMLGAGLGEMDLKAAGDPTTHTTDLTSWLGAIGGRQALTTWQGIDLAAKTDAFLTTVRSEAKMHLPEARGHAQRVRLLLEGQTAVALSPGSHLRPRMEMGGRWDSGTAEQGLGLELGGGLAYMQTDWGLTIDMQGRYLLMHEDGAFEDWGASVNVRLDPGIGGEGAYLMVAPVWGQPGSGVDQLWGTAAGVPGGTPAARAAGWRPANVEVDVGYGLALADGRGLLTPYGGLVLGDPGTARYRLGSRWAVSTLLDLSIEGERAEQPGQAAAHSVSVWLGWQW